jgi:hypothetical protein
MDFGLEDWNVGDPITAARLQKEKALLQQIANFLGAGGNGDVFQTLGGTVFKSTGTAFSADRFALIRLPASSGQGAGKYLGFVQQEISGATIDTSTDLDLSDYFEDASASQDALVMNSLDHGGTAHTVVQDRVSYHLCFNLFRQTTPTEAQVLLGQTTTYDVYLMTGLSFGC